MNFLRRTIYPFILGWVLLGAPLHGDTTSSPPGITQSGSVTANNCVAWVGNNKVKDSGAACGGGGGGTVTNIATGTGLTGGPITTTGTVSIDVTGVTAGTYTNPNITVNAQGQLTSATTGAAITAPQASFFFGTGTDGALSVSSGKTTLARDMYYTNLTISGTATICTRGYRIYVSGTLDISGAPATAISNWGAACGAGISVANGGNASGAAGGSGGSQGPANWIGSGDQQGNAGKTATTGAGASGVNNATKNFANGGNGAASGAGGAGTPNAGGAAGGADVAQNGQPKTMFFDAPPLFTITDSASTGASFNLLGGGGSGASAPSGGGDGTNTGGGGGGGGAGGPCIWISANTVARGTNVTASIIRAVGGNGGNGGNTAAGNTGGGAGGGGGGGGWIWFAYGNLTGSAITGALDASGGNGGNGGTKTGTGVNGGGGNGGSGGRVTLINLTTGTATDTVGTAGGAASGTTGGTGNSVLVNL